MGTLIFFLCLWHFLCDTGCTRPTHVLVVPWRTQPWNSSSWLRGVTMLQWAMSWLVLFHHLAIGTFKVAMDSAVFGDASGKGFEIAAQTLSLVLCGAALSHLSYAMCHFGVPGDRYVRIFSVACRLGGDAASIAVGDSLALRLIFACDILWMCCMITCVVVPRQARAADMLRCCRDAAAILLPSPVSRLLPIVTLRLPLSFLLTVGCSRLSRPQCQEALLSRERRSAPARTPLTPFGVEFGGATMTEATEVIDEVIEELDGELTQWLGRMQDSGRPDSASFPRRLRRAGTGRYGSIKRFPLGQSLGRDGMLHPEMVSEARRSAMLDRASSAPDLEPGLARRSEELRAARSTTGARSR